jgi:hypothetical protein
VQCSIQAQENFQPKFMIEIGQPLQGSQKRLYRLVSGLLASFLGGLIRRGSLALRLDKYCKGPVDAGQAANSLALPQRDMAEDATPDFLR